jgi:hypothetical protein
MIFLFATALIVLSSLKPFNGEPLMDISDQNRLHDGDRRDVSLTVEYSSNNSINRILKWYEDFHDQSPKQLPSDSDNHSQPYSFNMTEGLSVDNSTNFSCIDTSMVDVDIPSSYATADNTTVMNAGNSSADHNQNSILTSTSENEDQLLDTASILKGNGDMNDNNTKYIDIDDDVDDYHMNNPDIDNDQVSHGIEVKDDEVILDIQLVEGVKILKKRKREEISENKYNCTSNVNTDNNNTSLHCNGSDKTTPISNASVLSPSLDSRLKRLEDLVDIRRELVKDYNSRYHLDVWICYYC